MKNKIRFSALAWLALFALEFPCPAFSLLGTGFTYQGRLNDGASPANGTYDLQFTIYDASDISGAVISGPITNSAVTVSNGVFTVTVDFGTSISNIFNLGDPWLEIGARTNGASSFVTLTPRQRIAATPYAFSALNAGVLLGNLPATQLSGTINNGSLPASPNFSGTVTAGSFSGSGANVTSLNAGNISGGSLNDARLSANVALLNASQTFSGANTFNGNVGIGTASPQAQLNVNGNARIDALSAPYQEGLSMNFPPDMGGYGGIHFHNAPRGGAYDLSTIKWGIFYNYIPEFGVGDGGLSFAQDNTNTRLYISASGNVGVGSTFPQHTLDVNGDLSLRIPAMIYAQGAPIFRADIYGSVFVGPYAGNLSVSNNYNVAVGYDALDSVTSGGFNTALGGYAMFSNTKGTNNTATGYQALQANITGNDNTANGCQALYSNILGIGNTGDGYQALYSNVYGEYNIACGYQALYSNTNDFGGIAVGYQSLYSCTNGTVNTGIGYQALHNLKYGSGNLAIGYLVRINLTNGFGNIYIGETLGKDETNVTRIANIFGTTVASGVNVLVSPSGQLGTLPSSERFKQNIRGMGDASDVLLSLRPVQFQYKPDLDPQGVPQFGLIAEEVEKVDPNLVARDDKNQIYTVRYQAVSAMLLNEFLKEHRRVEEQDAELKNLSRKMDAQNSENAELKARLEKIERLIGSKYTAGQ